MSTATKNPAIPGGTRQALVLLVLVATLPLMLLQVGMYATWYYAERDAELQANLEIARAVGATFEEFLRDIHREEMAMGAALMEMEPSAEQARSYLAVTAAQYPTVRAFHWTDPQGKILASNDSEMIGRSIADEAYFREVAAGTPETIGDLEEDKRNGRLTFVVARRVEDKKGTLHGIIVAAVAPERLGSLPLQISRLEEGSVSVFDRHGMLVYGHPESEHVDRHWREVEPLLDAALTTGEEQAGTSVSPIDGRKRLSARVPLSGSGWVVGVGRPVDVAMAPLHQGLWLVVGLNGLVIAVAGAGSAIVGRKILRLEQGLQQRASELQEQSGTLDAFFQHTLTGLAILDPQFNFLRVNETYARYGARDVAEFVGRNHFEIYRNEENEAIFRQVLENKVAYRAVAKPFTFPDHPEWGTTYWDWTLVPVLDANGQVNFLVFTLDDATDRVEAERRDRLVRRLLELFVQAGSRKEYFDSALELIRDWFDCGCAGIRVVDADRRIPYESYTGFSREFWEKENVLSLDTDACACVRIAQGTPQPQDLAVMTPGGSFRCDHAGQFICGLSSDQQRQYRGNCIREGFKSIAVIPIRYREETLGVLHLADRREGMVPSPAIEFLESLSPLIGEAIHRYNVEDERHRAELALAESEQRYRSLVIASSQVVWTTEADGQVVQDMPLWRAFTGQSEEEIKGRGWADVLHPEDRQRTVDVWTQAVETRTLYSTEYRMRRKDGEYRYVAVRGVPVLNEDGSIREWVGTCTDITGRKQAEAELEHHRQNLERMVAERTAELEQVNRRLQEEIAERKQDAERLEQTAEELGRSNRDLEHFAYVASHDLQEPLRVIAGYIQLLARRYKGKLDDDADQFVDYTVEGVHRMQQLINDLLEYSRVGSRKRPLEPVDMEQVVERALGNIGKAIEESGAVVTHDPLPTVRGDATQLMQLAQNLIGNAIKFRREVRPEIHVGASREGGEWVFFVRDNGIGIERQYWNQVFLIFERLHSRKTYPGTGIGLAICKRIVERHGGRMWLESQPGQGSTFYFSLPCGRTVIPPGTTHRATASNPLGPPS